MAQIPGCRVRHFDINNGLPQNSITGLAFDKHHFLWVGTHGGLVKFDGLSLERITQSQLSSRIRMLFNTYEGEVLVQDDKLNMLVSKAGSYSFYLRSVFKPKKINSYIGRALLGEEYKTIADDSVSIDQLGYAGSLSWSANKKTSFFWVKFSGIGILLGASIRKLDNIKPLQHGFIGQTFIGVNNKGQMVSFAGTDSLGSIKRVACKATPIELADFTINAVWVQGNGTLYAIYKDTFFSMALQQETLSLTPIFSNLPQISNISSVVYEEPSGLLAIGTHTDGFYIAEPAGFRTMVARDDAPARYKKDKYDNFYSLLWTAKGELIADNGFRYGKAMDPWVNPDSIEPFSLNQDASGRIWYKGRRSGIVVLNDDFTLFGKIKSTLGYGGFLQTHPDTFWLNHYRNISRLYFNSQNNGFTLDETKSLEIRYDFRHKYLLDSLHFILCGFNGLYKYNWRTNQLFQIRNSEDYDYRSMVKSPGGNVYVNTYGKGYYLMRGDSLLALPLDHMKYLNYSNALVFDSLGFVWISTNNGLFQVKEEDLIAFADRKAGEVYMHYYDQSYGFATNEFNGGGFQSGLLAPNGNIYLASMKGLVIFNQNSIRPILPHYPIYIQDVSLNGKKIENWNHLSFQKGFSNFRIKISTPFYGHPYNLNVSYRIKGLDNAWNRLNNNLELTIQTLRGGEYTLEYRMLNGFGKNNYSYRSIRFKVQPYFYERPLFYLTVFIFFLAGTYAYAQYRTIKLVRVKRKLEAEVHYRTNALIEKVQELGTKNEELSAKTEMLNTVYSVVTHDLVSPLRFLQRAVLRLDEMPQAEIKRQKDIILHTTAHAEEFVNDLLVWIKLNHDSTLIHIEEITPYELIEKNINLFVWLANERAVELRHDPPFIDKPIRVSAKLVSILIRNFIDNALKYTAKGSISIKAYLEEDVLNIFIEDTGKGMTNDIVQQINARNTPYMLTINKYMGMKIIFDLLDILNGELIVKSELMKGTIIHLKIPVNQL